MKLAIFGSLCEQFLKVANKDFDCTGSRIVHLNFRAGSTFPVPGCTVSPGHWVKKSRHLIGQAVATRLTRSDFRLNLLLLKGQRCVIANEY